MSTITAVEAGIYLYGITDAEDGLAIDIPGIEGGEIEAIAVDGIAAIATRISRPNIRAQREPGGALQSVARADRAADGVALRLRHGGRQRRAIAGSRCRQPGRARRQLARLRGKLEMSLGVYWNTSNIFEFFVATNQELKEMRDRVFRPGKEPTLDERLELGRLFESLLRQCRQRHTEQVIETLSPCCAEIRAVDVGQEQMIMKLVCLVEKDRQQRFEEGVQQAARKFDDHYSFKYSGPWAPFDFVDVTLEL